MRPKEIINKSTQISRVWRRISSEEEKTAAAVEATGATVSAKGKGANVPDPTPGTRGKWASSLIVLLTQDSYGRDLV